MEVLINTIADRQIRVCRDIDKSKFIGETVLESRFHYYDEEKPLKMAM